MKRQINLHKRFLLILAIACTCIAISIFYGKNEASKTLNQETVNRVDFSLEIPKLSIVVPVITGIDPAKKDIYNEALTSGVAHMNGMSFPGQGGNVFIYGHSSAEKASKYQKVFANLSNLDNGDLLILNYRGIGYNYTVKEKKIVEKDDFSVLDKTDHEQLSLMTCWPIGTNEKRLIVVADL